MTSFDNIAARLTSAEDALHYLDPSALTAAQNAERAQSLAAIGNTLALLADTDLASLTEQGDSALTQLDLATDKLASELAGAQQASRIVAVVSDALVDVTRLTALLK